MIIASSVEPGRQLDIERRAGEQYTVLALDVNVAGNSSYLSIRLSEDDVAQVMEALMTCVATPSQSSNVVVYMSYKELCKQVDEMRGKLHALGKQFAALESESSQNTAILSKIRYAVNG